MPEKIDYAPGAFEPAIKMALKRIKQAINGESEHWALFPHPEQNFLSEPYTRTQLALKLGIQKQPEVVDLLEKLGILIDDKIKRVEYGIATKKTGNPRVSITKAYRIDFNKFEEFYTKQFTK